MTSKFKKRGGAKRAAPLSFANFDNGEEEEGAFTTATLDERGRNLIAKKKIKQAPGLSDTLFEGKVGSPPVTEDVTLSNEAAVDAVRKSKEDLRNYYQGNLNSYEKKQYNRGNTRNKRTGFCRNT